MRTIPTEFRLYGRTFRILPMGDAKVEHNYGWFDLDKATIELDVTQTKAMQMESFYHELVHSILGSMGHDLGEDEVFVDTFGKLLHQFMTTKRGNFGKLDKPAS